jgi:hypothetical protein
MRFVLHRAALDADDAGLRRLDAIIDRCEAGVHRLESPDADLIEDSHWYQEARSSRRRFAKEALALSPRAHNPGEPHRHAVAVSSPQDIPRAQRVALTPLTILVENSRSDGAFLGVLIEACGSSELQAICAVNEQPPALQIDSAGGLGEIPALVQQHSPRLFVVMDSDARWPGDPGAQPTTGQKARDACKNNQIPHHTWRKRCVENYIPDAVIEALLADRALTSAHARLKTILERTSAQRDHMPMKDHLSTQERRGATRAALYDEARDGAALALYERLAPLPHELPQLIRERREHFTWDGLLARDGAGEIIQLLAAITEEL